MISLAKLAMLSHLETGPLSLMQKQPLSGYTALWFAHSCPVCIHVASELLLGLCLRFIFTRNNFSNVKNNALYNS